MQGFRVQDIADNLGFSSKVVISAIKNHEGLTITEFRARHCPITYTENDIQTFRAMLLEGSSVQEISDHTGFSDGQIRYAIKQNEGLSIVEFRQKYRPLTARNEDASRLAPNSSTQGQRLRLPTSNRRIGRPPKTYAKVCPFCQKPFETKLIRHTYCSLSCASKSRRQRKTRQRYPTIHKRCERCGIPFDTKRPEQRYCGNDCRKASISKDKSFLTEIPCEFCDELFRPSQQGPRFCSRKCAYAGRRAASYVYGDFKIQEGKYVRFESSYELVFLLYVSEHPEEYQNIRRCNFSIAYEYRDTTCAYYPDFLMENCEGSTLLVEIKSSAVARRNPGKTNAKLLEAQDWCETHDAEFLYLTDDDDRFIFMCDYVASNKSLDVLKHVADHKAFQKVVRHCIECGKKIPQKGKGIRVYLGRKFCSAECRDRSSFGKKRRLPSSRHVCPQCKKEFWGQKGKVFCSKECYTGSQRTLNRLCCPVCGEYFRPATSDQRTCGKECGIVYRSARRAGRTFQEQAKLLLHRRQQRKGRARRRAPTAWTLDLMLDRLRGIHRYIGNRVPTYSQIYNDRTLRRTFDSCALAGAIYRFIQKHKIGSYNDFVFRYLGWIAPSHLTKEMAIVHLERVVEEYGGIPYHVGRIKDLLGVRGRCLEAAFKKYVGMSVSQYCDIKGISRVSMERRQRKNMVGLRFA